MAWMKARASGSAAYATRRPAPNPTATLIIVRISHFMALILSERVLRGGVC
ncbi:Uncharacterised protein [Mycobacterium tuberculosis]|nr:Uncharacterised protein [Mycobacterium tuberculosis]